MDDIGLLDGELVKIQYWNRCYACDSKMNKDFYCWRFYLGEINPERHPRTKLRYTFIEYYRNIYICRKCEKTDDFEEKVVTLYHIRQIL